MWVLIAALLSTLYVLVPITIYVRQRSPGADDAVLPLGEDDARVSDEGRSYLNQAEADLQREGFGQPVHVAWRGTERMVSYLSVLEHQDRSTVAVAMVAQVTASSGKTVVRCMLHLRSDFPDGRTIFTSNTKTGSAFPKNPMHHALRFPTITDPSALWHIHRRRVQKRGSTVRPTVDGDLIGYVKRELEESQQHWIAIGYYRRTSDGGVRPTMRGAMLMVWRMLPPWRQLNDQADARAAQLQMAFN